MASIASNQVYANDDPSSKYFYTVGLNKLALSTPFLVIDGQDTEQLQLSNSTAYSKTDDPKNIFTIDGQLFTCTVTGLYSITVSIEYSNDDVPAEPSSISAALVLYSPQYVAGEQVAGAGQYYTAAGPNSHEAVLNLNTVLYLRKGYYLRVAVTNKHEVGGAQLRLNQEFTSVITQRIV